MIGAAVRQADDLAEVGARQTDELHKAERWDEYQERGGQWDYDRWSKTYDQNQTRALEANRNVREYREALGWGELEKTVTVRMENGQTVRRLDVADVHLSKGVEHKSGYQSLTAANRWEIERDAALVDQRGWDITWSFDREPSRPLRDALEDAGLNVEIRE